MQLFISDYIHIDQKISINDRNILFQLRNVLRYKIGDKFYIQKPLYPDNKNLNIIRYKLEITNYDKDRVDGVVIWEELIDILYDSKSVVVSMPNKWEKLELICQKLTEIGIQNITIYFSKRSIIKAPNNNKIARIDKIIKESVEQSYGVVIPTLLCKENITFGPEDLIFYQWWETLDATNLLSLQGIKSIVVWPEWWRDDTELELFKNSNCRFVSIWSTVLRTETAAILWWWILKNLS